VQASVALALTLGIAALLAACGGSGSSPTSRSSTAGVPPCVANVDRVIAAELPASAASAQLPAELVAKLDVAVRAALKEDATPGAVVGVRSPAGTWVKAYGLSDTHAGTTMQAGVHTRIGSVTKTFTGTVLLQLAQDGELSLDDPIEKYVPGVPGGDRITLRSLSDMTSGVASYTFSEAWQRRFFGDPENTSFTPDELIAYGIAAAPVSKRGEYNYSNTNTILLGKVIEKVTGRPVFEVIKQRIIEPLGLAGTSWPGDTTTLPKPFARGYTLQGKDATPRKPDDATHWNPSWAWTAGALVSTVGDLLTYGRALGTGQGLLGPRAQTERLTSFPASTDYAYGLSMGCVDGWVGHTGELPGYNTSVYYDTATDTTVVNQTNSDIASGNCSGSPTLADNPKRPVCSNPSTRIEVALSEALGHTLVTPPQH
jgi:D-alanyl-D-alanine carboxypeptidase